MNQNLRILNDKNCINQQLTVSGGSSINQQLTVSGGSRVRDHQHSQRGGGRVFRQIGDKL